MSGQKTSDSTSTSNGTEQFRFQFFSDAEPITLPIPKSLSLSKPIPEAKSKILFNKLDDRSSNGHDNEEPSLSEEIEHRDERNDTTFFFFDIDTRLTDGLESFVRTEDLNELERTWPTKRKEIGEALRTKHRKAIQRKDKHRVFNHRRRQREQPTPSNPLSKSTLA